MPSRRRPAAWRARAIDFCATGSSAPSSPDSLIRRSCRFSQSSYTSASGRNAETSCFVGSSASVFMSRVTAASAGSRVGQALAIPARGAEQIGDDEIVQLATHVDGRHGDAGGLGHGQGCTARQRPSEERKRSKSRSREIRVMPCSRQEAASNVSFGSDRLERMNSKPSAAARSARTRPLSLNAAADGVNTRPRRSNGCTMDRSRFLTSRAVRTPARSSWTTIALRKVTDSERRKKPSNSAAADSLLKASMKTLVSSAYFGRSAARPSPPSVDRARERAARLRALVNAGRPSIPRHAAIQALTPQSVEVSVSTILPVMPSIFHQKGYHAAPRVSAVIEPARRYQEGRPGIAPSSCVSVSFVFRGQCAVSPGVSSSTCTPFGSTSARSAAGVPVSAGNVP